jgi:hypothetical protein
MEAEMGNIGKNATLMPCKCRLAALGMTAVLSAVLPSANSNAVVAPHTAADRGIRAFITPVELCEGCGGGGPIGGGAGGEAGEAGGERGPGPRGGEPEPARPVTPNFTDSDSVVNYIKSTDPTGADVTNKLSRSGWKREPADGKGDTWTSPDGKAKVRITTKKNAEEGWERQEAKVLRWDPAKKEYRYVNGKRAYSDDLKKRNLSERERLRLKTKLDKETHFKLRKIAITPKVHNPTAKEVWRGAHHGYPVKTPVQR